MKTFTAKVSPEASSENNEQHTTTETGHHITIWRSSILLLFGIFLSAAVWGCGSHTASIAVHNKMDPALLSWLCGIISAFCLLLCCGKFHGGAMHSISFQKLGPHSLTLLFVIKRILPLCTLSLLTLFLYFLALYSLKTTEVAALYSCNKALGYLLSWTILREQFMGARVIAIIACMAGVVMMSYTESIEAEAVIGRILALSSAIIAAVNQVLFQLLLGRLSWQETVIFLGLTGVCNTLLLWWIPLTMYFQRGIEKNEKDFMSSLTYLCITAVLFFLFQFLEKVGGHFIPQSGISFGIFISVFVSIGLDYPWVLPSGGYLLGISAIGVGFLLLLIPENWKELLGMKSTEQGLLEDGSEESRAKSIA